MTNNFETELKTKYDFRNEVLDVIIGGKSTLDSSSSFQVKSIEEADHFIRNYGYDLDNPIENAELLGNYHEALNFIRKYFLQPENPDGLKLEVPRKIFELHDLRQLFLMASYIQPIQSTEIQNHLLGDWACALLKVMHTIAHIDKDLRASYFKDIQKQIFDRFYKLIHRDSEGHLFLGENASDSQRVNLVAFETKPKKSRESIILKLLHKSENVAEDIFDRVGIRFITESRFDALCLIKYLKDKMIIMTPNLKPSRSRNTLIHLEEFRSQLNPLLAKIENGKITEAELISQLELAAHPPSRNSDNPHTSEFYRAIQFTCRQLIKLQNPIYEEIKALKIAVKSKPVSEDLSKMIERIELSHIQREIRFFYPFEVQIMDKQSAEENEKGRSAHSQYKRAQVITALHRVMGNLVNATR